jgi:hypothetical protein
MHKSVQTGAPAEAISGRKNSVSRFEDDTHFFVGTLHQYPKNWIIVGLFYPPK